MERIPILKMGEHLVVSIQVDIHDRLALALQDDLTEKIKAPERTYNMVSHNGTAGVEARKIREFSYPWPEKSLRIIAVSRGATQCS